MVIEKERVVSLEYTLKDDSGQIIDTSNGREPLVYLHGVGALIPALEAKVEGKTIGDKLNVVIPPEEGYGKRRDDLFKVVSKEGFQGDEALTLGMRVQLDTEEGPVLAVVSEINDGEVTLDLNHPLADVTLHFDVEVVAVRAAQADEITHGHVHGEGGVQH